MNLFLTGPFDSGKTAAINACVTMLSAPLWGFRSYKHPKQGEGTADIWLAEAAAPNNRHIVSQIENNRRSTFYPEVFETHGVALLQKITPASIGLVLMDEIGFMESDAPCFRREILRVLDMDIPVLGALRMASTPFLNSIAARADVEVLAVTLQNRDALPAICAQKLG